NSMIDELEESAVKLAKREREQAWREMAKQVAHKIKNPLTRKRLTVQRCKRKFDTNDEHIKKKRDEYSKMIMQQRNTKRPRAAAFSNFAKMPDQQYEVLNLVEITRLALDIFSEDYIEFIADSDRIMARFDKAQLIRVINNLVKNGIQAIPDNQKNKKIIVRVYEDVERSEERRVGK